MKVLVRETRACWIDFYLEVDVPDGANESETYDIAIDAVYEGHAEYIGSTTGDSLDFCDSSLAIVDSLPFNIERG